MVVLGHPRFGFSAQLAGRLEAPFSGPAFMALELVPGALENVTGEVRVFPLLGLDTRWSPHVQPVSDHRTRAGFGVEVVAVQYEFQRADDHAGNRMLRVRRGRG